MIERRTYEQLGAALEEAYHHGCASQIYDDAVAVLCGNGHTLPSRRARRAAAYLETLIPRARYLADSAYRTAMTITLTQRAVSTDDEEAQRDHKRADARDYHSVGYHPGNAPRLAYRIQSYRAERAFATYIGMPNWVRNPDGFRCPDVAGYSVRYGSGPKYGLVTHDRDGKYPYVCMADLCTDGLTFLLAGWLPYDDAQKLRARRVGMSLVGTTKPWVIPQNRLRRWPPEGI